MVFPSSWSVNIYDFNIHKKELSMSKPRLENGEIFTERRESVTTGLDCGWERRKGPILSKYGKCWWLLGGSSQLVSGQSSWWSCKSPIPKKVVPLSQWPNSMAFLHGAHWLGVLVKPTGMILQVPLYCRHPPKIQGNLRTHPPGARHLPKPTDENSPQNQLTSWNLGIHPL